MKMGSRLARILRVTLGIGVALLLAGAAGALQEWDQATVSSLASELEVATKALKNTLRKDTYIRDGYRSGEPTISRYAGAIDGIDKSARQLAGRLAKGEGYEQTLPIAKKIRTLVRDAEVEGAKIMTTAWMEEKLQPVEDLLGRLAPYYFED